MSKPLYSDVHEKNNPKLFHLALSGIYRFFLQTWLLNFFELYIFEKKILSTKSVLYNFSSDNKNKLAKKCFFP